MTCTLVNRGITVRYQTGASDFFLSTLPSTQQVRCTFLCVCVGGGGYISKDLTLTIHVHLESPPVFAQKPYGGVEVRPNAFLTSTVAGGN
jgi:hypothetical protein